MTLLHVKVICVSAEANDLQRLVIFLTSCKYQYEGIDFCVLRYFSKTKFVDACHMYHTHVLTMHPTSMDLVYCRRIALALWLSATLQGIASLRSTFESASSSCKICHGGGCGMAMYRLCVLDRSDRMQICCTSGAHCSISTSASLRGAAK